VTRPLAITLTVAVAVLTVVTVAIVLSLFTPDPLGDYPLQQVIAVTDTAVIVEGTKCVDADEPIHVAGGYSWYSADTPGLVIGRVEVATIRQPGCTTVRYSNAYPESITPGTWHLAGEECPINPNTGARNGRCRRWQTENFIVPDQGG
jgi:hypothetical protein